MQFIINIIYKVLHLNILGSFPFSLNVLCKEKLTLLNRAAACTSMERFSEQTVHFDLDYNLAKCKHRITR